MMDYQKLKKIEKEDEECFKCGSKKELYEDPNIEGLIFCKECWEERIKTEKLEDWGMTEEIPYDD